MKKTKVVPKFATVPANFEGEHTDIKPGKKYEVLNYTDSDLAAFSILIKVVDEGIEREQMLYCLAKKCAHLDGLDWILE